MSLTKIKFISLFFVSWKQPNQSVSTSNFDDVDLENSTSLFSQTVTSTTSSSFKYEDQYPLLENHTVDKKNKNRRL